MTDVYESALESDGSAQKELDAYMESIQAHIDQLKNSWDDFWVNENNREVINWFLDGLKDILDLINKVGGLSAALIGGGGIFAGFKMFKSGGRVKMFTLREYATGEFSSDVYELCVA